MNGENAAANEISRVINFWASEQTGREREVGQIKRHFGMSKTFKFPDSLQGITADTLASHMAMMFESEEMAAIVAIMIKNEVPMYQGELNPKWKFWDDVIKNLLPYENEDSQRHLVSVAFNAYLQTTK